MMTKTGLGTEDSEKKLNNEAVSGVSSNSAEVTATAEGGLPAKNNEGLFALKQERELDEPVETRTSVGGVEQTTAPSESKKIQSSIEKMMAEIESKWTKEKNKLAELTLTNKKIDDEMNEISTKSGELTDNINLIISEIDLMKNKKAKIINIMDENSTRKNQLIAFKKTYFGSIFIAIIDLLPKRFGIEKSDNKLQRYDSEINENETSIKEINDYIRSQSDSIEGYNKEIKSLEKTYNALSIQDENQKKELPCVESKILDFTNKIISIMEKKNNEDLLKSELIQRCKRNILEQYSSSGKVKAELENFLNKPSVSTLEALNKTISDNGAYKKEKTLKKLLMDVNELYTEVNSVLTKDDLLEFLNDKKQINYDSLTELKNERESLKKILGSDTYFITNDQRINIDKKNAEALKKTYITLFHAKSIQRSLDFIKPESKKSIEIEKIACSNLILLLENKAEEIRRNLTNPNILDNFKEQLFNNKKSEHFGATIDLDESKDAIKSIFETYKSDNNPTPKEINYKTFDGFLNHPDIIKNEKVARIINEIHSLPNIKKQVDRSAAILDMDVMNALVESELMVDQSKSTVAVIDKSIENIIKIKFQNPIDKVTVAYDKFKNTVEIENASTRQLNEAIFILKDTISQFPDEIKSRYKKQFKETNLEIENVFKNSIIERSIQFENAPEIIKTINELSNKISALELENSMLAERMEKVYEDDDTEIDKQDQPSSEGSTDNESVSSVESNTPPQTRVDYLARMIGYRKKSDGSLTQSALNANNTGNAKKTSDDGITDTNSETSTNNSQTIKNRLQAWIGSGRSTSKPVEKPDDTSNNTLK